MRNRRAYHGLAVAAAAALGAAVAVAGVAALRDSGEPPTTSARPATEPTVLGEDLLVLDGDPVPEAAALEACSTSRFAGGSPVEVLYGVRQLAADSQGPVVVLRNAKGELRLCDADGAERPSRAPVPAATDAEPVVFLNARATWECTGSRLDRYTATTWLVLDDQVATLRQRLWVDGEPGPWFSTSAAGGLAHLAAWEDGPLPRGTVLAAEYEVLDATGSPVAQEALPGEPAEVGWCEDGDVRIG